MQDFLRHLCQRCPLPKGVMLANFSRPTGAVYRRDYGIAPIKGGNAVRFAVPPPKEVQHFFVFRRQAFVCGLEAVLISKLFGI